MISMNFYDSIFQQIGNKMEKNGKKLTNIYAGILYLFIEFTDNLYDETGIVLVLALKK